MCRCKEPYRFNILVPQAEVYLVLNTVFSREIYYDLRMSREEWRSTKTTGANSVASGGGGGGGGGGCFFSFSSLLSFLFICIYLVFVFCFNLSWKTP